LRHVATKGGAISSQSFWAVLAKFMRRCVQIMFPSFRSKFWHCHRMQWPQFPKREQ